MKLLKLDAQGSECRVLQGGLVALARLASAMPKRFTSTDWHLLYSTRSHGLSLGTLYQRVHERGAVACAPS